MTRLAMLASLAERLSSATDQATVFEALRTDAAAIVGMDAADVSLVVDDRILSSRIGWPVDRERAERYANISVDDNMITAEAARTRRLVLVPDLEAYQVDDPQTMADIRATGVVSGAALPFLDAKGDVLGVLGLVARRRLDFDEETVATIRILGELVGNSLRRTQIAIRAGQMAVLAARLSSAATAEEVAVALRDHGHLPLGARLVNARLVDRSTRTLRALVPVGLPAELAQRYDTLSLDEPVPLAAAVLHDETVWITSQDDCAARYPVALDDLRAAEFEALAAVPLHDSTGAVVGVLGMAWRNPVRFDELVRATVLTIADLAAQTLERARLTDERVGDAHAFGAFTATLAAAVRRQEVADAVAKRVPPMLGARYASVAVLDAAGRALEHLALGGFPDDIVERFRVVPLDANLPAAVAFRTGRTTTSTASELAADYPALADAVPRAGIQSTAHVIVRDSTGQPMGLLSVGWSTPIRFDDALLARVEAIGDLTGQTLDRADLYDTEHGLVAAMQQRLLGAVHRPPSVELATRYLPAVGAVGIGGDWYDVVPSERGFTLVVGDVTGHGVEAVTAMAQLRTLIAGLVRAGEPLDAVFQRVEAMVDRSDLLLASAELFEVDTSSWKLRYCSAGHPWALLRRADGAVEVLDEGQQALLGAPVRTVPIPTVQLEPGDTLVAYTDGLVERRDEPITAGIGRLVECLRWLPPSETTEAVADALLDACGLAADSGAGIGGREDDAALVVLRRR